MCYELCKLFNIDLNKLCFDMCYATNAALNEKVYAESAAGMVTHQYKQVKPVRVVSLELLYSLGFSIV